MLPPDKVLAKLVKQGDYAYTQNLLMRISDREIAICLIYMDPEDTTLITGFLSEKKRSRVAQEQAYVERLKLGYIQYRTVIDSVIARFRGDSDGTIRSYIRPGGRGSR